MRNIILILSASLFLLLNISPLFANQNALSLIHLRHHSNSPIQITFDNVEFPDARMVQQIDGIPPGTHLLKVVAPGHSYTPPLTLFYGYLDVAPNREIFAFIDDWGRYQIQDEVSLISAPCYFPPSNYYNNYNSPSNSYLGSFSQAPNSPIGTCGTNAPSYSNWSAPIPPPHPLGGNNNNNNSGNNHGHHSNHNNHNVNHGHHNNHGNGGHSSNESPNDQYGFGHNFGPEPYQSTAQNSAPPKTVMSNGEFQSIIRKIKRTNFEKDRLAVARQLISGRTISSQQVKTLLSLFTYEQGRLNFAKYAFQFTLDQNRYNLVYQMFNDLASIRALKEYMAG